MLFDISCYLIAFKQRIGSLFLPSARALQPKSLTEPYLKLSLHTAIVICKPDTKKPRFQCANNSGLAF